MKKLLSREDWIEAAVQELSLTGFQGIAVEPLARRLGVSKGSFYWHFSASKELIEAVLSAWKARGFELVIAELARIEDPRERLVALIHTAWRDPGSFRAEAALAAAALAGNQLVAPVFDEVMFGRLEYVRGLYREMGLDSAEAERWALTTYSAYLGMIQLVSFRREILSTGEEVRAIAAHLERTIVPPVVNERGSVSGSRS
jgi:AcrR family transcriptional regulator